MNPKPILTLFGLPTLAVGYAIYYPGVVYVPSPLANSLRPTRFLKAGDFTIDPVHTFVGFDVGHLGLSRVQGRFDNVAGALRIDPKDLSACRIQVTVQTTSVDTNVAPRDADLRSANFFDVTKNPQMTFESTRIRSKGKAYVADGKLTLKGITREIAIPFKQFGPIKDPWGNTRIGVVADTIIIHRSDFGMAFDADSISDDVVVRISVEATEDKPR